MTGTEMNVDESEPVDEGEVLQGRTGQTADGRSTLEWPAVKGADRYHIMALTGNQPATVVAGNQTTWTSPPAARVSPTDVGSYIVTAHRGDDRLAVVELSNSSEGKNQKKANIEKLLENTGGFRDIPKPSIPASKSPDVIRTETIDGKCYAVTRQKTSLLREPDKFLVSSFSPSVLWPGNFMKGSAAASGVLSPWKVGKYRAPIDLVTSFRAKSGSVSRKGVEASPTGVAEAVNDLIKDKASLVGAVQSSFIECSSVEEGLLEFGFSAKFWKIQAQASGSVKAEHDSRMILAVYMQNAFQIDCVAKDEPADWFADSFTDGVMSREIKKGNVGPGNPPLYISSVSYGRVLVYRMVTTKTKLEVEAAMKATYSTPFTELDANMKAQYRNVMEKTSVDVVAYGGVPAGVDGAIQDGNLKKYFDKTPTPDQLGVISYTLADLNGEQVNIPEILTTVQEVKNPCNDEQKLEREKEIMKKKLEEAMDKIEAKGG